MEWGILGIILAIILFVIGLKVAKWIFWGISIVLLFIAGYLWFF